MTRTTRRYRTPARLILEPLEPRLLKCGDDTTPDSPPDDNSGPTTQPVDTQPASTEPTDTQPSDTQPSDSQPSDGGSSTQPTDNGWPDTSTDNSGNSDDNTTIDDSTNYPIIYPPDAPTHLRAQNPSAHSVYLTWSVPSDAGYLLLNRRDPNGHWHTLKQLNGDTTSFTDASVSPNNTYSYSLLAGNDGGLSDDSCHVSIYVAIHPDPTLVGTFGHIPGANASAPLLFFDTDGTEITLSLNGPGTATVRQSNSAYTLTLSGTTAQSNLQINTAKSHTPGDNARFSLLNLTDHAPLKNIVAPTTDLSGPLTLSSANALTLGNLNRATLIATTLNSLTLQSVTNSFLTGTNPITTLTAQRWLLGTITTAAINTLNITENFSPNLLLRGNPKLKTTLITATIHGQITGGSWQITGPITTITTRSLLHPWNLTLTKGTLTLLHLLDPTATLTNLHLSPTTALLHLTIGNKNIPLPHKA